MLIFAGLGNPGAKYENTRHNIGWLALDRIARDHGFGPWRSKFQGQVSEGQLGSQKVLLLKPETYMNLSGQSVGEAIRFYKLGTDALWVLHDELDLAPGKVRTKVGGGHAGHNGLRSLHQHVGSNYGRVRMGIGHPGHKDLVSQYVLHAFSKADHAWLENVLQGVADGAAQLAAGKPDRFLNAVALRASPPRSSKSTIEPARPVVTAAEVPEETPKSPLQRLVDRFR